jgi:hypothetical protein
MDVEGIYRKSGGTSQVNQVKSSFEGNGDFDISDPDLDIHAVSSTLKAYFRRLPVPLITFAVYDQFLEAGSIESPEQKARAMHAALKEIPKPHFDTLQFLVFHLSRVIQHSNENLVSRTLARPPRHRADNLLDDTAQSCCRFCAHNYASRRCTARADRYGSATRCCRGAA